MTKQTVTTDENSEEKGALAKRQQQVVDMGSTTVATGDGTIHTLTIIGQIEGHQEAPDGAKTTKYEHVLPLLTAVEESSEVGGLLVLLNTMGGDIEAGLGIAGKPQQMGHVTLHRQRGLFTLGLDTYTIRRSAGFVS